jgi:hypothetical protein
MRQRRRRKHSAIKQLRETGLVKTEWTRAKQEVSRVGNHYFPVCVGIRRDAGVLQLCGRFGLESDGVSP